MPRQKIIPFDVRLANKIKTGKIIGKLQRHIDGTVDMTNTQVQAARILLNKVMPDVKSIEIKRVQETSQHGLDNDALRLIINGESKRIG